MTENLTPRWVVDLPTKKIFQTDLKLPLFDKFSINLKTKQPQILIDIEKLLYQHGTSGFKIHLADKFTKDLTNYSSFYQVNIPDEKGRHRRGVDVVKASQFQISLECFFLFAWGIVASVARELYYAYSLEIKSNKVFFYTVTNALNKEHPSADITNYLNNIRTLEWFKYLNNARNRVEHGRIPMLEHRADGSIVLVDDQSVEVGLESTQKNYTATSWCQTLFNESAKFLEFSSNNMNKLLYE